MKKTTLVRKVETLSKSPAGLAMMQRLTHVMNDLDDIVTLTQGKPSKTAGSGLELTSFTKVLAKERTKLIHEVHRALSVHDLSRGRNVLGAYLLGKKIGQHFFLPNTRELGSLLTQIGFKKVAAGNLTAKKILIRLESGISAHGMKSAHTPVCYVEAGLIAGLLENLFQRKIEIQETKCQALGDRLCQFESFSPTDPVTEHNQHLTALASEDYSQENLRLLTTLASHAITAIDNAMLFEKTRRQALIDSLTELYNHGYFQRAVRTELKRVDRHHVPLSLVMVDVDNFKAFNDHYGHPVGDKILRHIATSLRNMVRGIDIVARYGGDEFAIIMPQTKLEGASKAAERILRAKFLNDLRRKYSKIRKAKLGLSLGVVSLHYSKELIDAKKLIQQTDLLLLKAKKRGGNQMLVGEVQKGKVKPLAIRRNKS